LSISIKVKYPLVSFHLLFSFKKKTALCSKNNEIIQLISVFKEKSSLALALRELTALHLIKWPVQVMSATIG
jgi:hypothetical protein